MNPRRRPVVLAVGAGLVLAALVFPGCGDKDNASQTRVITSEPVSKDATGTLTPLEKGKVRREILAAARAGLDAWMKNDVDGMVPYYSKEYVDYYRGLKKKYEGQKVQRVRKHSNVTMDVTEINATGTEAIITYDMTNESYFRNLTTGATYVPQGRKETELQLTMVKTPKGWIIQRMIGGPAVTD